VLSADGIGTFRWDRTKLFRFLLWMYRDLYVSFLIRQSFGSLRTFATKPKERQRSFVTSSFLDDIFMGMDGTFIVDRIRG
jgi:hypothetical protein